ncbi:MAG: hypothetical protein IM557_11235 [Chitinophagaceae bacterium]|nr:hypothetical protein [Chitinophagaceae bacterium]
MYFPAVYRLVANKQRGVVLTTYEGVVVGVLRPLLIIPGTIQVLATDFNADSDVLVAVVTADETTAVLYVPYDLWHEFRDLNETPDPEDF